MSDELDALERRMRQRFLAQEGLGPAQPEEVRRRRAAEQRVNRNPLADTSVNALSGLVTTQAGREQVGRGARAAAQLAPRAVELAQALPNALLRAGPRAARGVAEAAPAAVQSAVEDPMALVRELAGASTMERGREALIQAEMARDAQEREAAGRALAGEAGGQAIGAALAPLSIAGAPAAARALTRALARRPVTASALAATVAGSDTPGAVDAAREALQARQPPQAEGEAIHLGRQEIEDLYVRAGDQAPIRPDAARASRAGLQQGLSLDTLDDLQRGQRVSREDVMALQQAYEADPDNPEIAAALMQAQYDYDPQAFEAATNPEAFRAARTGGEIAIGAGTAVGSTLAGLALARRMGAAGPIVAGGGAGAAKGAIYGMGSGVGEVAGEDRARNAVRDAGTTGTFSVLAVPLANRIAMGVNRLPIYGQQGVNAVRDGVSRVRGGPGYQGPPAMETRTRLFAPQETVLREGIDAGEVVARARSADAARPEATTRLQRALRVTQPAPLVPRLEALAATQASGVSARQAAAMEPLARRISRPPGRSTNFTAGLAPTTAAGRPSAAFQRAQEAELVSRQALSEGFDDLAFAQLSRPNQQKVRRVVRQRIAGGQLTPEEIAFLQTDAGQARLQSLRMMSAPFPFDYTPPPANARVNPGVPVVGRDRVPVRTTPETAEALGDALGRAGTAAGAQTAAGPTRLQDLLQTQTRRGFAPYRERDAFRDLVQKPLAVGGAIPATELFNTVVGDQLPDALRVVKGDPGSPLGGDPEVRSRLTRSVLSAEAGDAQTRLDEAVSGTTAEIDREVADLEDQIRQMTAERVRLARVPRSFVREGPDGERRVVDNTRAYEDAQARAAEMAAALQELRAQARAIEAGRADRIAERSRSARADLETARNRQAVMGSASTR